jgi:hypothetical protein
MENVELDKAERFLRELTEISIKYGVGISGPFDIFVMEEDDFERRYTDDGRGKYEFY